MLPEAGATELIFLAAVALIVVGPKDLPILMRKVGQAIAKMRGLANEFRASFDELARQSELDELRKEVDALRNQRFADPITPAVQSHFQEINASLNDYSVTSATMMGEPDPELLADAAEHGTPAAHTLPVGSAAEGGEPEAAPPAPQAGPAELTPAQDAHAPVVPPPANEGGQPQPPAAEARG